MSPFAFVVVFACLVALLAAALGWRRKPSETQSETPSDPYPKLRSAYAAAQRRRIDGDSVGHFLALVELAHALEPTHAQNQQLAAASTRARLGGELPSHHELECLERRIRRQLAELRSRYTESSGPHAHSPVLSPTFTLRDSAPSARARRRPRGERLAGHARVH